MSATRVLRDGTKAIASTIYLKESSDHKAAVAAKLFSKDRKRKVSKSRVIVEAIEEKYPP